MRFSDLQVPLCLCQADRNKLVCFSCSLVDDLFSRNVGVFNFGLLINFYVSFSLINGKHFLHLLSSFLEFFVILSWKLNIGNLYLVQVQKTIISVNVREIMLHLIVDQVVVLNPLHSGVISGCIC